MFIQGKLLTSPTLKFTFKVKMQFTPAELTVLQQAAEIILRAHAPAKVETAGEFFIITRGWVDEHKTAGGAWKAKQLSAIGVRWPPARGWPERVEGATISQSARLLFESFAGKRITNKASGEFGVTNSEVVATSCDCNVPPWENCIHTRTL